MFGSTDIKWLWRQTSEDNSDKCTVFIAEHSGENIMLWGCMDAIGEGGLTLFKRTMDSKFYCDTLQKQKFEKHQRTRKTFHVLTW